MPVFAHKNLLLTTAASLAILCTPLSLHAGQTYSSSRYSSQSGKRYSSTRSYSSTSKAKAPQNNNTKAAAKTEAKTTPTSGNASNLSQNARSWIETKGRQAINAFAEEDPLYRYEMIDTLIRECFDTPTIGRFVMGRFWRRMHDKEKESYLRIFERYALASYKSLPLNFSPEMKLDILSSTRTDEDDDSTVTVSSVIVDPDELDEHGDPAKYPLEFRVRNTDNGLKIFDVKFMGASLLLAYRDRFAKMIKEREEDITWFLDDLYNISIELENEAKDAAGL